MSRRIMIELATLLIVAGAALAIRAWIAAIYLIPSESMLPTLMAGDHLLVEKWPYAMLHRLPERGDMMIFRPPPLGRPAYVKRVIGLPGDLVALRNGIPVINNRPLPRWRIADLVVRRSPNSPCDVSPGSMMRREHSREEGWICRYPRYREILPDGRIYDVLDIMHSPGDDFGPALVPADRLFLLGDNRDRSADSRLPTHAGGGVGMVPLDRMIGRAVLDILSVDGSARLGRPAGWLGAVRWQRSFMSF